MTTQLPLFETTKQYFDTEDAAKTFVETLKNDQRYSVLAERIWYEPALAHWVAQVDYVEK